MKNKKIVLFALALIAAAVLACGSGAANGVNLGRLRIEIAENRVTEAYVGESVPVAAAVPVDAEAVESITVMVQNVTVKQTYEVTNGSFIPLAAGTCKVFYGVRGVNGDSATFTYDITVMVSDNPILVDEASFPYAFLEGKTYALPAIRARDYAAGEEREAEVKAYIETGEGARSEVTSGTVTPAVKRNGDCVKLVYVATNETGGKTEASYSVPVLQGIDPVTGAIDLGNFFVMHNVTSVSGTDNSVEFSTTESYAAIQYANLLSADLSLSFCVAASGMGAVSINLTDSADPSVQLKIKVIKPASAALSSTVSVNGSLENAIAGSFYDEKNGFTLDFKNLRRTLSDAAGSVAATVLTDAAGKPFAGFPSGAVKLEIELLGVVGNAAIGVKKINQQIISDFDGDDISPFIVTDGDIKYQYERGDTITVLSARALDVIDPNARVVVEVRDTEGKIVADVNGLALSGVAATASYRFAPERSGEYSVLYTATDAAGNRYRMYVTITVVDNVPPVLNLSGTLPAEIKRNASATLPQASPTDNETEPEALKLLVTVNRPDGGYEVVNPGDTVVFAMTGTYYVRYTVYDAYYNADFREFVVTVK